MATKTNPRVVETMENQAEPSHEDMEQKETVRDVVIPDGETSSENAQACSQNTFSDPTIAKIQEELAQARHEREKNLKRIWSLEENTRCCSRR